MASENSEKCRRTRRQTVAFQLENFRRHKGVGCKKRTKPTKIVKAHLHFRCRLCSEAFRTRCDYDGHWSQRHTDASRMLMFKHSALCDKCGKVFSNDFSLSCHKKYGRNCIIGSSRITCDKCFKQFEDFVSFRNHLNEKLCRANDKVEKHVSSAQLPTATATALITSEQALVFDTETGQSVKFDTDNNFLTIPLTLLYQANNQIVNSEGVATDPKFYQQFGFIDYDQKNQIIVCDKGSVENISMPKRFGDLPNVDDIKSTDYINNCSGNANRHANGFELFNNEFENCVESLLKDDIKDNDETPSTVECVQSDSPEITGIYSLSNVNSEMPILDVFDEPSNSEMPILDVFDESSHEMHLDSCSNIEKDSKNVVGQKHRRRTACSYTCRICSNVLGGAKKYRVHFLSMHKELPIDDMFDDGWKCSVCESVHSNINGLRSHWQLKHPDIFNKDEFKEFVRSQNIDPL